MEIKTYIGPLGKNLQPYRDAIIDGVGTNARFVSAKSIATSLDGSTTVVVEDTMDTLRLIAEDSGGVGTVTTLAGQNVRASEWSFAGRLL